MDKAEGAVLETAEITLSVRTVYSLLSILEAAIEALDGAGIDVEGVTDAKSNVAFVIKAVDTYVQISELERSYDKRRRHQGAR